MGGIAAIAKSLGHSVSGCDQNVYPPMSTQLEKLGIELKQGYLAEHLDPQPDLVVIGNACSRGNEAVETVLNRNIPYTSGPQWLKDNILCNKWVLAVAGTHGKTTTSSMLAWVLEYAGMSPGFLIGGVAQNFGESARVTDTPFFVIEADEYDSAFFDKRSKFVHYMPRTLVINNLEFDHADIFDSIEDIKKQFHHVVRTVPSESLILANQQYPYIKETLDMGCWSEVNWVNGPDALWQARLIKPDGSEFAVMFDGKEQGVVKWLLIGQHNVENALMAISAARNVGVTPEHSIAALSQFATPKRRLELKGEVNGVKVYDDFAHHPTAISTTLAGVRASVGHANVIAILEPRSNTMKNGTHQNTLAKSFKDASSVYLFEPNNIGYDLQQVADQSEMPCLVFDDIEKIIAKVVEKAQKGDHIVVMSNGGFGGIHYKLLAALA